jgi:acyl-CoA synthetase (AMP-forming)/AMP-acid ligase II
MNVSEMLARNSRIYPDETALIECNSSERTRRVITWRQFDEDANRIANALISRGIKKGDKVLHLMFNSIEWLTVYFGILRTGAWVVPLNYRYYDKDIKYCADISEARMIIFGEKFLDRIEPVRSDLSFIENYLIVGEKRLGGAENLDDLLKSSSHEHPNIELTDEDECGLYFTSGTTGVPKPVLLTHKNMECAAVTVSKNENKAHDDNFVFMSPLYHTGSKMRWFGNLIIGSRATMLIGVSPRDVFKMMSEEKGTILMLMVPWAMDILLALDKGELRKQDYDLSHWRLATVGAQPVPPSLVKRWREWFPEVEFDIGYGLSESTGTGCVHLGTENWRKAVETKNVKGAIIGRPGFNWKARIVSENGEDVLPGEVGELIVKGEGVMKGYYKNPEKTAKTIKDGWLYTGDLARVDSEGFIYLVDRKKDVIITGGENIFPVEVEEVIHRHPKIKDVAVIGLPDERLGEIAAAVIEVKPGMSLTEEEIIMFCDQNLPRYKRPRRIIYDKVPRNPTGKIEKPALREKYGGSKGTFKV